MSEMCDHPDGEKHSQHWRDSPVTLDQQASGLMAISSEDKGRKQRSQQVP